MRNVFWYEQPNLKKKNQRMSQVKYSKIAYMKLCKIISNDLWIQVMGKEMHLL